MIYLSGKLNGPVIRAVREGRPDLGFMMTINHRRTWTDVVSWWAVDTGLYSKVGERQFDEIKYFRMLEYRYDTRATCLFATAPDVFGQAQATVERALPYLPRIRDAGYRVALIAQDGAEKLELPWDEFDVLFLGGRKEKPEWKESPEAHELVSRAIGHGKLVHMGRVNSWRRLKLAASWGIVSVDGTHISFGPDRNLVEVLGWLDRVNSGLGVQYALDL